MPRIARIVAPGLPHHPPSPAGYGVTSITQRGNRRADVFFDDDDRRRYLFLLRVLVSVPETYGFS